MTKRLCSALLALSTAVTVSYTHLDVYKRQVIGEAHTGMLCDGRAKQLYLRGQALPVMGGEVDEQVVRA